MDLSALIERLENATAPDRGADGALAVLAGWAWHGDGDPLTHDKRAGHWVEPDHPNNAPKCGCTMIIPEQGNTRDAPRYTASIDAAHEFVQRLLPGWGWSVGEPLRHPGHWASVWRAEEGRTGLQPDKATGAGEIGSPKKYAATAALALCLAALRATRSASAPAVEVTDR